MKIVTPVYSRCAGVGAHGINVGVSKLAVKKRESEYSVFNQRHIDGCPWFNSFNPQRAEKRNISAAIFDGWRLFCRTAHI